MYRKRSRWWLSLALAASTACPIYAASQSSNASLPGRGCFFHDSDLDLPPFARPIPTPVQEERIDVARIQEQLHQGWNVVARSLDDASNRLLSTFEYAKELAAGISLQSMMANLPEDSKALREIAKAPVRSTTNRDVTIVAQPEEGLPPSPDTVEVLNTWAWDHADYVECDDDRFNVDPPKPVLAHDDYVHRIIDEEYSDYDLSVREQLWMKGTVPGREPSRLPIFGETENTSSTSESVAEITISDAELATLQSTVDEDDCWRAFQREEAQRFIQFAQSKGEYLSNQNFDPFVLYAKASTQVANQTQRMTLHIVDSLPRHVRKPNLLPRILDAYASTYELGLGKYIVVPRSFHLNSKPKTNEITASTQQISLPATTSYSPKLVSIRSMKTTATKSIASGLKAIGGWFHNLADQISSMSDAELASLEDGRR